MKNPYDGPNPLDFFPHPFDPKYNTMTDQQKVTHWIKQIDRILENDIRFVYKQWPGGIRSLKGIKETIEKSGKVSRKQIQAIKNIRYGKN